MSPIAIALHVARHHAGGLTWRIATEDAKQIAALVAWSVLHEGRAVPRAVNAMCDRLLRDLGWMRARDGAGHRRWMRSERVLQGPPGYRFSSERHRVAYARRRRIGCHADWPPC